MEYLVTTYITNIVAIAISRYKTPFKTIFGPINAAIPFVARALMTNGNVNAAKLG